MATYIASCAHCGALFEAERAGHRFCSTAHRAADWRERRAAAHQEDAELRRLGADLLGRLTRAVIEGASEPELDEVLAEARRVLPER
ncbi:hypothetical protein [uncultured Leifsonia sp.]|uniref:hypothetical protein n=1 Tax=uncultured Leifsonia sp. TaxID=340359 RepID=UPI0025F98149|nr:hypothetical protein [uncultured Leifsonia sp.]